MGKRHEITRDQVTNYIVSYRAIVAGAGARSSGRKRLIATLSGNFIVEVDGNDVHVGKDLDAAIARYNDE